MKNKSWLPLLISLALVLLASSTGVIRSLHTDTEQSTDNTLIIATIVTTTLLNDGFEGDPWDSNWDGNGTTTWVRDNSKKHDGHYAAKCSENSTGYLTSDDLDTSGALSITVSFWFRPQDVENGDMLIQLYNGSTYVTLYDLIDCPTFGNKKWCYFSQEIFDPQYFLSNLRLRFDGSGLVDDKENYHIDDVLITIEKWS